MLIDLSEVGAHMARTAAGNASVTFGLYLPGIGAGAVVPEVRVIHADDQFAPGVMPQNFNLQHSQGKAGLDLWTATVDMSNPALKVGRFGSPGTYLYRYRVRRPDGQVLVDWMTDPFARATGTGQLAAFEMPAGTPADFQWQDAGFTVPSLDELIVYELQVGEYADTFLGVIRRLDYLQSLGVNALELMPVTSVKQDFDWGYGPLHFFAPEERYGGPAALKALVDACHKRKMAVILDSVYQHVDSAFPYQALQPIYDFVNLPNPFIGAFVPSPYYYGPTVDFNLPFSQDFFQTVNAYWLDEYHVDGFRYDFVPGYYDGPTGNGYARIVFNTYQKSLQLARFKAPDGTSRIIQVAEDLDDPQGILRDTYTNATWQDRLLNAAESVARGAPSADTVARLLDLGLAGYTGTKTMNGKPVPVAPFQYFDSHDHSCFLTNFFANPGGCVDRAKWFKLRPYAVALLTAQGIPMLWQGQELAENYTIPDSGQARIDIERAMDWEFFYDDEGQALVKLYRRLGVLRRSVIPALRSRTSYYYDAESRPADGIVAYRREAAPQIAVTILNFSDSVQQLWLPFPAVGQYQEMVVEPATSTADGRIPVIQVASANEWHELTVPANMGFIYFKG
jgi:maltooligosyltrehalose trehalohydrolase